MVTNVSLPARLPWNLCKTRDGWYGNAQQLRAGLHDRLKHGRKTLLKLAAGAATRRAD